MTTSKHEIHSPSSKPIIQAVPLEHNDILIQVEEYPQFNGLKLKPNNDLSLSILDNQKKLTDLNASLDKIIDAIAQNQSVLSRISTFWGELPLWLKIISGALLVIPTLAVGIVFHLWILIAASVVTLIVYTLVSLLLDNHHSNSSGTLDALKEGMTGLGNVLISVIDSLNIISQQFSQAVADMTTENERLKANVDTLSEKVNTLTQTVTNLQSTEEGLRSVHTKLETTTTKITQSLDEQTSLANASQSELNQVTLDLKKTKQQLAEKVTELELMKNELAIKVKKFESICSILNDALGTMSGTLITDKDSRVKFLQKLNDFISDTDASFDRIVDRICEAERQLAIVTEKLNLNNQLYQNLLNKQDNQLSRLEQIVDKKENQNSKITSSANALSSLGFYANRQNQYESNYMPQAVLSTC